MNTVLNSAEFIQDKIYAGYRIDKFDWFFTPKSSYPVV